MSTEQKKVAKKNATKTSSTTGNAAQATNLRRTAITPRRTSTQTSGSSSSAQATPQATPQAAPAPAIQPKPTPTPTPQPLASIRLSELKPGDIMHVTYLTSDESITSFLYVHLEPKKGECARVRYRIDANKSKEWQAAHGPITLSPRQIAYARVVGNIPGLNSQNIASFMVSLMQKVPVNSGDPTFDTHKWTSIAIRYLNKEYLKLPANTISTLHGEMIRNGKEQATKATECREIKRTPKGTEITYPGYQGVIEIYDNIPR